MSEVHVGQYPKLSRRDFLKLGAAGVAATTALLTGCGPEAAGDSVEFRELQDGQTVDLVLPNEMNPTPVVIEYPQNREDFTPLQIRQDKRHNVTIQPFKDGAATTRMMGEVTDPHIYRMVANPALNGIDIHAYPSVVMVYHGAGRTIVPPNQEYNVLRVITRLSDYMGDRKPHAETNAHQWGDVPVTQFGEGACIGKLKMVDGKQAFSVLGFVLDLRALVPAPAK